MCLLERVKMKKSILLGFAGMLFVSASAQAISISGQAGEDYTNIGVGFGTESTGLALSGNWMHNDDDGDAAGVGLGLNIPVGPLLATVGGKGIYTNPKDSDEGYAAAVGGGLQWKSATASVCSASIIIHQIRCPAVSKVMKKRMQARVSPLCAR